MMKHALALVLFCVAAAAAAHDGVHDEAPGWTLDFWVTGPLLLSALLYGIGFLRLWRRSRQGRAKLRKDGMLFALGWVTLAGAVVSPLHAAGERSFTMHMIEHEVIMLLAALLLVLARPGAAMLWSLPSGVRQSVGSVGNNRIAAGSWRFLTNPLVATLLQAAALCLWHVPSLFDRALASDGWHIAQHISFLVTALLFWWAMTNGPSRSGYGISGVCLLITALVGGFLGALMTFSGSPWYEGYAALGMTPIGLTPIEDQQLAGLLMWIPGGLFHAGAALYFLYKWLLSSEEQHTAPAG